jgi:prepilin signal peptidase PulO-like enzyme (type II secretory pathway)
MIFLGIIYSMIIVLMVGIAGFYLPWFGKRLLIYRKISVPSTKDTSILLGVIASFAGVMILLRITVFWEVMLAFIFLLFLLLIGWMDWHTGYILDQLTIGGSLVIIAIQLGWNSSVLGYQLINSMFIFLLLFLIAKGTNRLGQGDAKLMGMCALLMNWQSILLALWLASTSGLVFMAIQIHRKKIEIRKYALPFGPHLALGSFSSYLYGDQVINLFFSKYVLSTLVVHILY